MTGQSALETATAFLDAFTSKDFETASSYLAKDFVFAGPMAHFDSAEEFLAGAKSFAATIRPGWAKVAAFGDRHEALLLYDITLASGDPWRIADHYRATDGKIAAETILWDTHGFR